MQIGNDYLKMCYKSREIIFVGQEKSWGNILQRAVNVRSLHGQYLSYEQHLLVKETYIIYSKELSFITSKFPSHLNDPNLKFTKFNKYWLDCFMFINITKRNTIIS